MIVLIGNYPADRQESMIRFADMLCKEFDHKGFKVQIWQPLVVLGRFAGNNAFLNKWLGYFDKWIIFPTLIKYRLLKFKEEKSKLRFHVCDHSNSPYLAHLPLNQSSITCHDVIAIKAGLGYSGTNQTTSRFGKILQKWILKNLINAQNLATVSEFTMGELKEIIQGVNIEGKNWRVILNPFNANFYPMSLQEQIQIREELNIGGQGKYILHVGSKLPRKNRPMLLKMVDVLKEGYDGYICYAGEVEDDELNKEVEKLGFADRVIFVLKPSHDMLRKLYASCYAFIFPSFNEGFGWPLIEAQACGVPVIASNVMPMPEVGGMGALYADPFSPADFASSFRKLYDKDLRNELIEAGYNNCKRFKTEKIIDEYIEFLNLKIK